MSCCDRHWPPRSGDASWCPDRGHGRALPDSLRCPPCSRSCGMWRVWFSDAGSAIGGVFLGRARGAVPDRSWLHRSSAGAEGRRRGVPLRRRACLTPLCSPRRCRVRHCPSSPGYSGFDDDETAHDVEVEVAPLPDVDLRRSTAGSACLAAKSRLCCGVEVGELRLPKDTVVSLIIRDERPF